MTRILVNALAGAQALLDVGEGGSYFDPAAVLWDERADGPLPVITLGGMVRVGGALQFDAARKAQHDTVVNAAATESARLAAVDAAITGDATIAQLRGMSAADFDTWWAANVTTTAQAIGVLKRLARIVIRRIA